MSLFASMVLGIAALSLAKSIAGAIKMLRSGDWPPRRTVETSSEIPF